jgi:imidazolonepropionase-like amidohydrolase
MLEDDVLNAKHLLLLTPLLFAVKAPAQQPALVLEHGIYNVHRLLHTVGTEEYTVTERGDSRELNVVTKTLDFNPAMQRSYVAVSTTTLTFARDNSILKLDQPLTASREATPAALQMVLIRYWYTHHRPARVSLLLADGSTAQVEIKLVGYEAFNMNGQLIRLTRYTLAGLGPGREVLWMNDSYRVAALMTFAGLPREEILDQYSSGLDQLFQSGVRQQMLDLDDLARSIIPIVSNTFAITGARLIAGDGQPPIINSTVVVRDNRIAYAGPSNLAPIPAGARVVHAEGQTLLPGLIQTHTIFAGAQDAPALLAEGITTARDCGGEFQFLTTVRARIDDTRTAKPVPSPHLILAGLIDSTAQQALGIITADTPAQAIHDVDLYADSRFDEVIPSPLLTPAVRQAIVAEAARRNISLAEGCSVTPAEPLLSTLDARVHSGLTPQQAIESATINAARKLHIDFETGSIAAGKRADFLLVAGNPLEDISAFTHIVSVAANGHLYSSASLQRAGNFSSASNGVHTPRRVPARAPAP